MKKNLLIFLFFLTIYFAGASLKAQDVPYVPTPYEVVDGMLKLAEVTENDIVYDLGCGDGRIVVTAAKKYGARGVGVDSNPDRIKESNENAKANNVTDKVEFHQQNLFETEISEATVVTLYLLSSVNIKLRPKLFEELKPGTRVVSNSFDMDDWEPDKRAEAEGRSLFLWIIPANVSGKWEVTPQDESEKYIINIDQKFQNISGTVETAGKKYEINDAKLDGNNITFSINRNSKNNNDILKFSGKVSDNKLEGSFSSASVKKNFTALRDEKTKKPLEPSLINAAGKIE